MKSFYGKMFVAGMIACFMLTGQSSPTFAQSPQLTSGLSWLSANQSQEGYWMGVETTDYHSTAEALTTLSILQSNGTSAVNGLNWLNLQTVNDTHYLAQRISINGGAYSAEDLSAIFSYRQADGGFGGFSEYLSNNRDTALALLALKSANYTDTTVINNAISYLINNQNPDGGWGFVPSTSSGQASGDESSVYMTSLVSRALQLFSQTTTLATAINEATTYIISQQQADGSFGPSTGSGQGSVYETAHAYIALIGATTDVTILGNAVNYLTSTQSSDGSWNQDPYSTALALRALYYSQNKPTAPPPASTTGTVSGVVIDSSTNQPLAGVSVSANSGQLSATTNSTGQFVLSDVSAGVQQITLTLSGYATSTVTVNMIAGSIIDIGTVGLSVNPTTGILQGIVTDATTSQTLSGATITITGTNTWTAATGADGSYKITDIIPESVSISASKTGYATVSGTGSITAGGSLLFSPSLSVAVPVATTGSLKGTVIDALTGQPLNWATVQWWGTGGQGSTNTTTAGDFAVSSIVPGSYSVSISAYNYTGRSYNIAVIAGSTANLGTVKLEPVPTTGTVQGIVRDAVTNSLLSGITITASIGKYGESQITALTAADGAYLITNVTPYMPVTISASKAGYYSVTVSGVVLPGETLVFSPALSIAPPLGTTGDLKGIVVDRLTDQAIQGALVVLSNSRSRYMTGIAGEFMVSGIDQGIYYIYIYANGYLSKTCTAAILAGGTTDIGTILLSMPVTTGTIGGTMTDSITGSPLEGVTVTATGTSAYQATTGLDGTYQIPDVSYGMVSLSAGKPGYDTVISTGNVPAGSTLIFSAGLTKLYTTGDLKGTVLDAITGQPIQGGTVSISGMTAITGSAGEFTISSIAPGTYTVSFSAPGYTGQSYSIAIIAGNVTDLGTVMLNAEPTMSTLTGKVTDLGTKDPIPFADVVISGTGLSTKTSLDGTYRLSGITSKEFNIKVSAVGYDSKTYNFTTATYGTYTADFDLAMSRLSDLSITLSTGKQDFAAYESVPVTVEGLNAGSSPMSGTVNISILDANGSVVGSMLAMIMHSDDLPETSFVFEPGVKTPVSVVWNTGNYPPGLYSVQVKVKDLYTSAIIAEKETALVIEPTQAIAVLSVTPLPRFTRFGAEEQIEIYGSIDNRSNVDMEESISYEWRSPSGSVVYSGTAVIALMPEETSKSLLLETFPYTFTEGGEYQVQVNITSGPIPASLSGEIVSVAPGIRIDPSQGIAPATVLPDGDKRVRIDINLKGVKQ